MKLLAFETATPSGGVALLIDGVVQGEMRVNSAQAHSRQGMRLAEILLDSAGLAWSDLDVIATSHGPGSFTGVRVGLTIVKSLSWSLKCPCISVDSLEAMAVHAAGTSDHPYIVPVMDARMKEVYTGVFRNRNGWPERVEENAAISPEELVEKVRVLDGKCLFSGEGARKYYEELLTDFGDLTRGDHLLASPGATGLLAYRRFERDGGVDPGALAAVYLREPVPAKK